jgi:hypothetical protein
MLYYIESIPKCSTGPNPNPQKDLQCNIFHVSLSQFISLQTPSKAPPAKSNRGLEMSHRGHLIGSKAHRGANQTTEVIHQQSRGLSFQGLDLL